MSRTHNLHTLPCLRFEEVRLTTNCVIPPSSLTFLCLYVGFSRNCSVWVFATAHHCFVICNFPHRTIFTVKLHWVVKTALYTTLSVSDVSIQVLGLFHRVQRIFVNCNSERNVAALIIVHLVARHIFSVVGRTFTPVLRWRDITPDTFLSSTVRFIITFIIIALSAFSFCHHHQYQYCCQH